jgi:hypothetical protein
MGSRFTAGQRRALAMLASAAHNGVTQSLLNAHGLPASLIAGLVDQGLATVMHEKVRAGGKLVDVSRVRITQAGRHALGES